MRSIMGKLNNPIRNLLTIIIITKNSNPPNFLLLLLFFGHEISKAMVIILSESVAMAPDFYVLVHFRPVFPIWVQFSRYIGICVELELILAIFAKKSSSFLGSHKICLGPQIENLVEKVPKLPTFSVNFKGIVNSSKTVEKSVSGKPLSIHL